MRIVRVIAGVGSSLVAHALLFGALFTLGNHLFGWDPTKISVEWQTTLWVAGTQAVVGMIAALLAAIALRGTGRVATLALTATAFTAAWVLLCLMTARMNAGYLWLLVGVPFTIGYFAVRGVQHLRARAA